MRVAIFGRVFDDSFSPRFQEMISILTENKVDITIYDTFFNWLSEENTKELKGNCKLFKDHTELQQVDFFFSIGGDGTFLEASGLVRDSGIPMVGINTGRLGFLADISEDEIKEALSDLFSGRYKLQPRTMIELIEPKLNLDSFPFALNEFTVHKTDSSQMITASVKVGQELLSPYWADGVIVATPTGSTAYSLSVGGPIITPEAANLIISPIAPHNLAIRPVVIPDHQTIEMEVESRGGQVLISLDSRSTLVDSGTIIKIRKSNFRINVIKLHNHGFYSTLREKLHWGVDRRN